MTDSKPQTSSIIDPNAAQEAEKYDNPVPSRDALLMLLEQVGSPMTHQQVCEELQESDPDRVEALRRRLIAMARDGQLLSNRRDQFFPIDKADLIKGRVQGHRDGYGFVLRDGAEDVYLSNRQMRKVFHGDQVAVQILGLDRRGRPEGKIIEVIERNTQSLVGRYFDQAGVGVVQPDNKRIPMEVLIPPESKNGAEHGQFVVVSIQRQPEPGGLPLGEVTEVLGEHLAPGMEIEVAIRSHDIPHEWPESVVAESEALSDEVKEEDKTHRVDLRALPFVTIDGEDARDFDDAVYCEKNRNTGGWRLYVAIADVSHYVNLGTALDQEAHQRATSVYFPGYVVPMLPEKLSNGLCSLNPEVDRLVMVCEMTISKAGNISGFRFMEAVIHSHARLTYNKVWKMLETPISEEGQTWRRLYSELTPHIDNLYQLFKLLRGKREERGAMDFDSVETRIVFDAERKIQEIVPTERNDAHMLIEECMLAANVCSAKFLSKYKVPGLYRVHAGPTAEKLENLKAFLGELGLSIGTGRGIPTPKQYQTLLEQIADRPDSHLIQTMLLRSLSQAVYQPDNGGHFGLAYDAYTHFTSPIRRYPDLLVHRAIRSQIRSDTENRNVTRAEGARKLKKSDIYPYDMAQMLQLGEHCSMAERRADEATRDVTDFLKCEYIRDRIGDVFEGVISAVTGFGLFVELKNVYVEGLVHVSSLQNDYYQFDAVKQRLIGERTRRSFRLGDTIWIQVAGVNLDDRKVDFELAAAGSETKPSPTQSQTAPIQRMPRKRSVSSQEEPKPFEKDGMDENTSSKKSLKSKTKKKSLSKRQKLNGKKSLTKAVKKKGAKKAVNKKAKKT